MQRGYMPGNVIWAAVVGGNARRRREWQEEQSEIVKSAELEQSNQPQFREKGEHEAVVFFVWMFQIKEENYQIVRKVWSF